jgi:hypothetical protein
MDFEPFQKIARLSRDIVVTEKIDGTNAQVFVSDDLSEVKAGSRNRWLTIEADNFGFARRVAENRAELLKLGPGRHFGEWWGSGIQRGYGLVGGDKRFSLFNTAKWGDDAVRPACCSVVPVLYEGVLDQSAINGCLFRLQSSGSVAVPGFMKPEGVVIFHTASSHLYKKTIEGDEKPKGRAA